MAKNVLKKYFFGGVLIWLIPPHSLNNHKNLNLTVLSKPVYKFPEV